MAIFLFDCFFIAGNFLNGLDQNAQHRLTMKSMEGLLRLLLILRNSYTNSFVVRRSGEEYGRR